MSRPSGITTGNAAGAAGGRFYLPQLDGLRFCAFLLVFLHHSPVFPGGSRAAASLQALGWAGVDLFFVLSAYLLIALLEREHRDTGATDFKKFFIRRALRIWPLFYVYVAICVVYFIAVDGRDMAVVVGRTIGHLFFLDNFFSAFDGQYNPLPFTQHLWTIAFEEQVYLFIPLLFAAVVALRRSTTLFTLTALALVISQPLLRWGLTRFHDDEITVWVIPFLHADAIIAGLLLAAGVGSRLTNRISGDVPAIAGALLLGVIFFVLPGMDFRLFGLDRIVHLFTLLALAFFLIVLGCLDGESWTAWLMSRQPLLFLGRISYGLYVWHWVGNQFSPGLARSWLSPYLNLENQLVAWFFVVVPALSLTVALSVLSYFVLERPFLRIKRRFTLVPNRAD